MAKLTEIKHDITLFLPSIRSSVINGRRHPESIATPLPNAQYTGDGRQGLIDPSSRSWR